MINNIELYLTNENIYLLANWGILPFWLMLIFAPNSSFSKIFVHSVIAPLILSLAYILVAYKIYFEGNISSYTYTEDGASLYDVLNLYQEKRHLIRDILIKGMKDIDDLEDYIKQTEDVQLGLMLEVVKKYGDKIPGILKEIKAKHIKSDRKDEAEIIFSTVHRSKGMEYDAVKLASDFIDNS